MHLESLMVMVFQCLMSYILQYEVCYSPCYTWNGAKTIFFFSYWSLIDLACQRISHKSFPLWITMQFSGCLLFPALVEVGQACTRITADMIHVHKRIKIGVIHNWLLFIWLSILQYYSFVLSPAGCRTRPSAPLSPWATNQPTKAIPPCSLAHTHTYMLRTGWPGTCIERLYTLTNTHSYTQVSG